MNIVADENLDRILVDRLRSDGHKVVWITEDHPSIDDEVVLDLAFRMGYLLITEDIGFGELIFKHLNPSAGILLLRIPTHVFTKRASRVSYLLEIHGDSLLGQFSVATSTGFRSRPLP
jgi:predicted nuclease of predicted toxin-antitoxin system